MKLSLVALVGVCISTVGAWALWSAVSNPDSCAISVRESNTAVATVPDDKRQAVLVELFTSEGCSSCPPADRQLTFLHENQGILGAEVIALAYHVDYWDRLGWKDRFSSAAFSERQNSYTVAKGLDSNYTPQMIVDGDEQFVGSDGRKADRAVSDASKSSKGNVALLQDNGRLKVTVDNLPLHGKASVLLAIAEDKLTTDVRAGENSGRKLEHTGVVRSLKQVGRVTPEQTKFESSIDLPQAEPTWKTENLRYVVFVQEEESKKVLAVASTAAKAQ